VELFLCSPVCLHGVDRDTFAFKVKTVLCGRRSKCVEAITKNATAELSALLYSFDALCVAVKGDDFEGKYNIVFLTVMFLSIFSNWIGPSAF
jgi:hypothetical protein